MAARKAYSVTLLEPGRRRMSDSLEPISSSPGGDSARLRPGICLVFLSALLLFLMTMPLQVTMEDSGLFLMSVYFRGLSHPPGYPLYNLLAWPVSQLPFATVAVRVHCFSAICGAAALALFWRLLRRLGVDPAFAYVATAALAVSDLCWAQCVVAEVYSLNFLCFIGVLSLCWEYRVEGAAKWLWAAGLVFGLGLSNHWPLMIASAPGFLLLVLPRGKRLLAHLPVALFLCALGLLPYVYMYYRSRQHPEVCFFSPLQSFSELKDVILRRMYYTDDSYIGVDLKERLHDALFLLREIAKQLTWIALAVFPFGLWRLGRRFGKTAALALLAVFLLIPILVWREGFVEYDLLGQEALKTFMFLPAVMLALGFGLVLQGASEVFGRRAPVALLAAALPAFLFATNLPDHNLRDDYFAYDYGVAMLTSLEPDAVIIVGNDIDTGVLGYLTRIEGLRADVTVMQQNCLFFSNRVAPSTAPFEEKQRKLREFIAATDRPVYYTETVLHGYARADYGYFFQVDKSLRRDAVRYVLDPVLMDHFDAIEADRTLTGAWKLNTRNFLIGRAGQALAPWLYGRSEEPAGSPARERLRRAHDHYIGRLMSVAALQPWEKPETLLDLLDGAEDLVDSSISDRMRARLFTIRGQLYEAMKQDDPALANYLRSIEIDDSSNNTAIPRLLNWYAARGRTTDFETLRAHYPAYRDYRPPAARNATE